MEMEEMNVASGLIREMVEDYVKISGFKRGEEYRGIFLY